MDGVEEQETEHQNGPKKIISTSKTDSNIDAQDRSKILAFNVSHALVSLFLLWLLAVQMIGFFFFAKGFLLTRLVLDSKSECRVLPDGSISTVQNGCWHPRTFDKAIIIVIDALRYDFTIPTEAAPADRFHGLYLDNFPLLYDTAIKTPERALLLPFIADPPTSTLQRLKGLTTGTLPTFIDIGSNFAGTAIEEDNLVSQLRDAGKTIVHLGDDTWHALFPDHFDSNLTRAYDSFNVRDLHTVDNGVIEHIVPLLEVPQQQQWDVIIAHFLGVDHAGHRYGPDHQAMADKLQQMNQVLSTIIEKVDDRTLVVVMGDHGMDPKGDHGGESDEEVEAALWMYSSTSRFGRIDKSLIKPPATAKERSVGQIDLVSTLSILLGLPIPFNNLGTPIVEAFTGSKAIDWENLAKVELLAFDQVQRYQSAYSQSRDLGTNNRQYASYREIRQNLQETGQNKWQNVHNAYGKWHHETITMFRQLWAKFNIPDMLHGVELSGLSLVVLILVSRFLIAEKSNLISGMLRCIGIGTGAGFLSGPLLGVVLPTYFSAVAGCIYGVAAGGNLGAIFYIWQHRRLMTSSFSPSSWSWFALVFTICQSAGFAANSYTIHEDTILLFFLSTFGIMSLISSLRQKSPTDRILGAYQSVTFIFLTRISSFSKLCREEQIPGCQSTFYLSSTSVPWQVMIPFAIALFLPEIVKAFYKGTASYAGSAGFWIGFSFRMALLLTALHWTLDAADNGGWFVEHLSSRTLQTMSLTLARSVFAVALPVGVGTFIWAKPCIDISLNDPSLTNFDSTTQSRPQIQILGYANAFGSRYFLFIPTIVLCITILLPPMGQFSLAICTWQILCLLEILDTNDLTISAISNSAVGPIVLAMLGSYHFFKTGHQAVLSSIQWNAAFVPFRNIHYPWSPLLVTLNTFGAQILCAAAVPLTALWKRPISTDGLRGVWNDVMNACLTHSLYYATIQLATTMWAGHLRRHLMLYRVFMPRFLMASGVLMIVDFVMIFIALYGARITGLSVGEVFGY